MAKKTPGGRRRTPNARAHGPRRRVAVRDASSDAAPREPAVERTGAVVPSRLARQQAPIARATMDYSYVSKDLRRIAISFAGIIAGLIALAMIFR